MTARSHQENGSFVISGGFRRFLFPAEVEAELKLIEVDIEVDVYSVVPVHVDALDEAFKALSPS